MRGRIRKSDTAARDLMRRMRTLADDKKRAVLMRFFKTGKGQYGEGDIFLGITVPRVRLLAAGYSSLRISQIRRILLSRFHEERMAALLIMIAQYKKGAPDKQEALYRLYRTHTACINNWDLVDISAPHIVGAHLQDRSKSPLYEMARSSVMWERRIAIVATFSFIRQGRYTHTLRLARILLGDSHDLMHKATGWMLREVGKRDKSLLDEFLNRHCAYMPRTMLRYAIERLPQGKRKMYMEKKQKKKLVSS